MKAFTKGFMQRMKKANQLQEQITERTKQTFEPTMQRTTQPMSDMPVSYRDPYGTNQWTSAFGQRQTAYHYDSPELGQDNKMYTKKLDTQAQKLK